MPEFSGSMVMRALGVVVALLAVSFIAAAGGGVVLSGIGSGFWSALDGSWSCQDSPVTIQALFAPGERAILNVQISAGDLTACETLNGGALFLGVVDYDLAKPAVGFQFACVGSEEDGIECPGSSLSASVGPLGSALESTLVYFRGEASRFTGSVMAT